MPSISYVTTHTHTAARGAAKEAGRLLSVSLSKLYELLRSRELQSYADGYSRRVTMASIYGYVERQLADSGGIWRQITAQPRSRQEADVSTMK